MSRNGSRSPAELMTGLRAQEGDVKMMKMYRCGDGLGWKKKIKEKKNYQEKKNPQIEPLRQTLV